MPLAGVWPSPKQQVQDFRSFPELENKTCCGWFPTPKPIISWWPCGEVALNLLRIPLKSNQFSFDIGSTSSSICALSLSTDKSSFFASCKYEASSFANTSWAESIRMASFSGSSSEEEKGFMKWGNFDPNVAGKIDPLPPTALNYH